MAAIDALLKTMVDLGASDLHLTSNRKPMFRVDGDMIEIDGGRQVDSALMEKLLGEITPTRNQGEFKECWDTDFAYAIDGLARFRVNRFADHRGPGAVLRIIPSEILTAEQLGLPPIVRDFCELTKGLVLVTGPTGSGKSTTLAAMIDHINRSRSDHIITIEDPIEFVHPDHRCLVNQREVGRHTKTFKAALRAALREDPDIVLVGELRDLETIEIALETAETGHLVFGTLHTTTAPSTVDRIIDQFPANRQAQIRTMLAGSLKGVVAQTLCKKQPKGRIAALEILVATKAVAALIREGKIHQLPSVLETGSKAGMQLLNQHLIELVKKGLVTPHEAYVKSVEKQGLEDAFGREGIRYEKPSESAPAAAAPAPAPAPNPVEAPPAAMPSPVAEEAPAQPESAPQPSGGGYEDPFEQFKQKRG